VPDAVLLPVLVEVAGVEGVAGVEVPVSATPVWGVVGVSTTPVAALVAPPPPPPPQPMRLSAAAAGTEERIRRRLMFYNS
jgi:hypothetical protein